MIRIESADAMHQFGENIGKSLKGGEVLELVGDVGAGKTTFVRGLAQGMGVTEQVQSPSFTINRVYDAKDGMRLIHYDFYRLENAGIMSDELDDALRDKQAVVVIEWAGAVEDVLPTDRLTLRITPDKETSRLVSLEASGDASKMTLGDIHDHLT